MILLELIEKPTEPVHCLWHNHDKSSGVAHAPTQPGSVGVHEVHERDIHGEHVRSPLLEEICTKKALVPTLTRSGHIITDHHRERFGEGAELLDRPFEI